MKRNALLGGLLLAAACSGGNSSQPIIGGTLGSTHDTSGLGSRDATATPAGADPTVAFRKGYSNPGGMWLPQQMTLPGHADVFKKLGVKLDAKVLADPLAAPLNAIVSLGGYCTASFVSPEGLIVTNHHCVQGLLKVNATPDDDLVKNGFLAKTRTEEKSGGAAQRLYVAQAFTDVTKQMRDGLEAIKDHGARDLELEKRMKVLIAGCEKDKPGIKCKVSGFFRGGLFVLIENLEIRDVRLVYVPSRAIGNYGGEIDNWAWPRHTGDFAFIRAYVGKDGKPADYSTDNVPFRSKHHLKVSTAGVDAGDFVMVTGYPGSTSRTKTFAEVKHYVDWYLPYAIAHYGERYKVIEELAKDPGATGIKAAVHQQSTQNGLENLSGQLEGLTKSDLMQKKLDVEAKVKELLAKPGFEAKKQAVERMEQIIAEQHKTSRVDYDRSSALKGSTLLTTSLGFVRWAEERTKKDLDRRPGYQERDLLNATARQKQFARDFDRTIDRAMFRLALVRALQLPESDRPWLATLLDTKRGQKIDEALIDKTLESWYGATKLEDDKLRLELLAKGTTAQLKASKDPFVKAALRVWPILKDQEKKDEARSGELVLLAHHYADVTREALGGLLAPDANGTLRITYGTVKAFKPTEKPFTVASEIPAKNTGAKDFDMPKRVLDAIKAKVYGPYGEPTLGGELPVDYLSDLDITGGNSGSPTLNDRGELVGLAFDGTIAGVASNVVFDGATTRTIHVDARYMLWVMDRLDNADHVLREMGIQPKLDSAPDAGGAGAGGAAGR